MSQSHDPTLASFDLNDPHVLAIRLMEHLVVPTFVLDGQGKVIVWNRACERLTGLLAREVLGTTDHWRAFYDQPRLCLADILAQERVDELETLYPWHAERKESGVGLQAENWCIMPRAQKRRYLAIDAGPIYNHEGDLIAVVETLRDITEQKLAQTALEALANRDGLTDLANRRSFDTLLGSELMRAQATQMPLSLALCDIDYFKQYNDLYGHLKGDECLKAVANAIGNNHIVRASDMAARYGGEEFAIVMPATDAEGARLAAERVRASIELLNIPHKGNPETGLVTISLGVVTVIPDDLTAPEHVIAAADTALYQAKQQGRNRVCVHLLES